MRKRFQTILLAAGLSAALLSGCVYASDTGVTEAAVEMAADEAEKAVSEAVETAATEAEKAQAEAGADALIEVDGGVQAETAPRLVEAGVDVLVSGSYVFKAPDPKLVISQLRSLGNSLA